jgi:NDP-sugar pyrophosphorylase family protein
VIGMPSDSTVSLSATDVLILAGGLGTRLRGVLTDRPKILAPVASETFLDHLLTWLSNQGARRIVLALGHQAQTVLDHLRGRHFTGLEIVPVIEPRPLGTAGAVTFARAWLRSDPVMIMNGDTWIEADLGAFLAEHQQTSSMVSMICVRVPNPGRYGRVEIDGDLGVLSFREKDVQVSTPSWINGGVYLFRPAMLEAMSTDIQSGSLEHDVLGRLPSGSIHAFCTEGRFLDIGTPEDLAAAESLLMEAR